jgi:riboflavin kinase / FMN adenylyltransferase
VEVGPVYRCLVQIVTRLEDLPKLGVPLHLALGVFDGVHAGHQSVIARAVDAAEREGGLAGMLTFDPHPIRVIAPNKAPTALLETLDHKARAVAALGVQVFIPLHFDLEFAKMDASDFIEKLTKAPIRTLAIGEDWRFGHNRGGDVSFLRKQADLHGFKLEAVAPVMHDGERISSTRIRQAIRDGNLTAAAQMLGRPYSASGNVIEGRKLGRTLDFPTANLNTGEAQLPPDGVWAVRTTLADGQQVDGVANLGLRPTVDGINRAFEVHLFNFSGDLYGQNLEVEFLKYLRGELKFPDLDSLRTQIQRDAIEAQNFFTIEKSLKSQS